MIALDRGRMVNQRAVGNTYEGVLVEFGVRWPVLVRELETAQLGNVPSSYDIVRRKSIHQGVVTFRHVFQTESRTYLVMDQPGMPLHLFLQMHRNQLEECLPSIAIQLCQVVVALQQERIVHCDLDPDNVFICVLAPRDYRLVLGDIDRTVVQSIQNSSFAFSKNANGEGLYVYQYAAPKWASLEEQKLPSLTLDQLSLSDMWRLGGLLLYIFSGGRCGPESRATLHPQLFGDHPQWLSLCQLLLHDETSYRIPSSLVLEHPVFWSVERTTEFYRNIYHERELLNLSHLLVSRKETLFYPHSDWTDPFAMQGVSFQSVTSPSDPMRLIQLMVMQPAELPGEELFEVLEQQCNQMRLSDPMQFFLKVYPCLLSTLWESLFYQQRAIEIEKRQFEILFSI